MTPCLVPRESLSQVVFMHDYIQLVFQEDEFSIYNDSVIARGASRLRKGQLGFCDALVSLIGVPALSASTSSEKSLVLTFANGTEFSVERFGFGPEAWDFQSRGCPLVAEQNG